MWQQRCRYQNLRSFEWKLNCSHHLQHQKRWVVRDIVWKKTFFDLRNAPWSHLWELVFHAKTIEILLMFSNLQTISTHSYLIKSCCWCLTNWSTHSYFIRSCCWCLTNWLSRHYIALFSNVLLCHLTVLYLTVTQSVFKVVSEGTSIWTNVIILGWDNTSDKDVTTSDVLFSVIIHRKVLDGRMV